MNLRHFYWYFNDIFPDKFIDLILRQGLSTEKQIGITGTETNRQKLIDNIKGNHHRNLKKHPLDAKEKRNLSKKRNSEVCWLSNSYIYDAINPYIFKANKNSGWHFQWDWNEPTQFAVYKKNMFYEWHMDSWETPYSVTANPNLVGKIRKLSSILLLSDPKDFEGGELELDFKNGGGKDKRIVTELTGKGSLIVFPSFVWHRLKPVTKGIRYSLATFHLGWPWK